MAFTVLLTPALDTIDPMTQFSERSKDPIKSQLIMTVRYQPLSALRTQGLEVLVSDGRVEFLAHRSPMGAHPPRTMEGSVFPGHTGLPANPGISSQAAAPQALTRGCQGRGGGAWPGGTAPLAPPAQSQDSRRHHRHLRSIIHEAGSSVPQEHGSSAAPAL